MLNGIAPIIIFNFKRNLGLSLGSLSTEGIPLLESLGTSIPLPPIPVYLSEKITGVYPESETKSIDIETIANTTPDGGEPETEQNGLNSTVTISLLANSESVGLSILIALSDLIFQRVTSKEYSITYIHGAMTIFNGLLESFNVTQNTDNTLYRINITLSSANTKSSIAKAATIQVPKITGAQPV
jgi:hypothetical protein